MPTVLSETNLEAAKEKLFADLTSNLLKIKEERIGESNSGTGKVVRYADGVAIISGLQDAAIGNEISIVGAKGRITQGFVHDIDERYVNCLILDEDNSVHPGLEVRLISSSKSISIQAGPYLFDHDGLPRCISPLGKDFWTGKELPSGEECFLETPSPGIFDRKKVDRRIPISAELINSKFQVGYGQRMLIIGDKSAGKTRLMLNVVSEVAQTTRNRAKTSSDRQETMFIYVCISKSAGEVRAIQNAFKNLGRQVLVVATRTSDPASLHYIVPFVGTAIAEWWRDHGRDVVIIYDDLSQQAAAYRQIALILRVSPGREAYPGDIFYLHSRLLERSAQLNDDNGGGSLTAFPIVETIDDELGYIPTNLISITDGQLFLNRLIGLDNASSIDLEISISRVECESVG